MIPHYRSLPFGLKESPYIYQTIGQAPVSYLRSFGVTVLEYIDDFLVIGKGEEEAQRMVYVLVQLLSRLGYTLSMSKSNLVPQNNIRYLGMLIDFENRAFRVPDDKKEKMAELRKSILESNSITMKTLQRWTGMHFSTTGHPSGKNVYPASQPRDL